MHDMHTYPHQVFVHLQISFLSPGGGRSWITTSAEWLLGTAWLKILLTQGTILKIQFEEIIVIVMLEVQSLFIYFLEVVEKWFLGWIPLAGVFSSWGNLPASSSRDAGCLGCHGIQKSRFQCHWGHWDHTRLYGRHEKTFGIWHIFSYSPTDDDLEKEFPFSSMSILWCPYTILADLMSNQMDPPWTKQQIAAWNIPVILKTLQLCFNSQIAIINHFISFPHVLFQGRHKLCKLQLELHQRPTTKCYPESSLPGLTILGIADTQPKPKA